MALNTIQPPCDTRTLHHQIDELCDIHKEMEALRTRASRLLAGIAAYNGPAGPAYGPLAETIAEDAAVVVDGRRHSEFAAAPFDGKNIRAQARLCHVLGDLRAVGDALVGDIGAAQQGGAAQLGGTLAIVVDITQYSLENPFAKDPEALDTISAPLLRRVEKYQAGIQVRKGILGRFRSLVADSQAENDRLSEEVQLLRGAPAPETTRTSTRTGTAPRRSRSRSRR